jgi:beta-galactosidase
LRKLITSAHLSAVAFFGCSLILIRPKFQTELLFSIEMVDDSTFRFDFEIEYGAFRMVRTAFVALVVFGSSLFAPAGLSGQPAARTVVDFNRSWKFIQADPPKGEQVEFDDSAWSTVAAPHDWSIGGPVSKENASASSGRFFPTGVAWYRKSFTLPPADSHRHVYAVFDGVMANSDVWINGFHLGHRPNGYVSFYYDLTGHLRFGQGARNVIAVRCDTSQQKASRWYEGGGIYRPVRLVVLQDVHLEPWSTNVTTPSVSAANATVQAQTEVVNESAAPREVAVEVMLVGPNGQSVGSIVTQAQTIEPGAKAMFRAELAVPRPALWDIDRPSLYRAIVRVRTDAATSDNEQIVFGIREFHFSADTGFWLNGRNFKIKGAAVHADGGAFGIAVPIYVWKSRLNELRALGVNAIRTAHNSPSPEFLDLCDRMGFLVMDELFDCWTVGKNPYDYHLDFDQWSSIDARDTVRRDRNHPSIILWSAGNEIHDTPHAELALGILRRLIKVFHENDPTRPVTQALFRPNVSHDYQNGLADMLDVVGQNYRENEILAAHADTPTRKILGTENTHDRTAWLALRDNPPYAGQFLRSGLDYLGEAGAWPAIGRPFGLLDRTGMPRPRGLERQSWWSAAPNVHLMRRVGEREKSALDPGYEAIPSSMREPLLADWTPRNTAPHTETVEVYTNCEEVELLLNGESLGRQKRHEDASPLRWDVQYAAGTLQAVAYNHTQPAARDELRTAGKAARINLIAKQSKIAADEVIAVEAIAVDSAGVHVPDADAEVEFDVSGPAQILATDNGSNTDHESFLLPRHRLYGGRAVVWLRATAPGGIVLRSSVVGLATGTMRLRADVKTATAQITQSF